MLGESVVTVEGTVVEPNLGAVTVDGQPATVTGQAWLATVGGLAEGSHVFQVRAEDRAGNATALPWPVTIDLNAPEVVITSPAGGATRDATVTVAGTVKDRSLEALTVNGSSATWAGDPASPAGATFSAPGVALVDQQDNPITVEVVDDVGVKRLLAAERYPAVGFVNITLPAAAVPAPAPRVEIRVFREEASGARTDTGGVTVTGTPVQVGVRAKGYVVRDVKIRGESQTLRTPDPLKQTKPGDPLAFDVVLQDAFVPPSAGSYTISATALDPAELASVTGETVVQVLAEPGGGTVSVPGRPGVLAARTTPKDGAKGVSVAAFPQVSFTEPVRNVTSTTVRLVPPAGDPVPLRILGVTAQGQAVEIDDATAPSPLVVSLTLQPLVSLSYGTAYRLELTQGITDEDGEALVAYGSGFTTFLPEEVGQSNETDPPTVTGLAVLGERGYVLETLHAGGVAGPQQAGLVRVYDVTDPGEPRDLTDLATGSIARTLIAFPPRDIAGEEVRAQDGSLTGEKLIAVAAAPRTFYQTQGNEPYWTELKSTPSNLFLYDVTEPDQAPRWVGAANLTNGIVDGIPNRIAMREGRIYAATFNKGIQVVSIENLRFPTEPTGADLVTINKQLFAGGLNPSAVVLTIPVRDPANGPHVPLNDVKAGPLVVAELPRTVVLATGSRPAAGLVVADGQTAVLPPNAPPGTQPIPLWQGELRKQADRLDWGSAVALARVDDRPLALVGGYATLAGAGSQTALAVVDLTPMAAKPPPGQVSVAPTVLGFVKLEGLQGVGDILLLGNTAIVSGGTGTKVDDQPGGAALVDLTDPENAVVTGLIPGIGSRMALDPNGMLLSSDRSFLKGTSTEASGVRTAALQSVSLITSVREDPVLLALDRTSLESQELSYRLIGVDEGASAELEVLRDGELVKRLAAPVDATGRGTRTLTAGIQYSASRMLTARVVVAAAAGAVRPGERVLRGEGFEVEPLEGATLSADEDTFGAAASNRALTARLQRDADSRPPVLSWAVTSGGTSVPVQEAAATGIYTTTVVPSGVVGVPTVVELRRGETVLGRGGPIILEPGDAVSGELTAERSIVPADGTTEVLLTLRNLQDRFGNTASDGTEVAWEVIAGLDGDVVDGLTTVAGGVATARFRAGIEEGEVRVRSEVGGFTAEATIEQKPLIVALVQLPGPDPTANGVALVVSSGAGPPAEGTPVGWGQTAGLLQAPETLVGGKALAMHTLVVPRGYRSVGTPYVFATVGRTRHGIDILPSLPPGKRLELDSRRLSWWRASAGGDLSEGALGRPGAETLVHVRGGLPGETVTLEVGTAFDPPQLPVALFPLDARQDEATEDLLGGPAAAVGPGVSPAAPEAGQLSGGFRFTGEGELTVSEGPALGLRGDFGINGHVLFESLEPGQKVFERAGSYGLEVVEEAGKPRLEFHVIEGGQKRRALSAEVIEAGKWYRFAAHLRSGRLQLGLGEHAAVRVADEAVAADATDAPLALGGGGFLGRLDEIEVYDFSRPAFASLAPETGGDQQAGTAAGAMTDSAPAGTRLVVQLDEAGEGRAVLRLGAEPAGELGLALAGRVGSSLVRIYEPPVVEPDGTLLLPPVTIEESLRQRFGARVAAVVEACADGLATGEEGGAWGAACDIAVNLIPGVGNYVGVTQGLRDLYLTARNFNQGKRGLGNYVKGGLAVLGLAAAAIPVVAGVARAARRAAAASQSVEVAAAVTEAGLAKTAVALASRAEEVPENLLRVLNAADDDVARQALLEWLPTLSTKRNTVRALDRVGDSFGYERVAGVCARFARDPRIGTEATERLVRQLARLRLSKELGERLSDEALEGMALLFARGAPRRWPASRMYRVWSDIKLLGARARPPLNPLEEVERLDNFFRWVKRGEEANIPGWHSLLAKSGGQRNASPTQGLYNVLQHLDGLGWKNVIALEQGIGTPIMVTLRSGQQVERYPRYVDIVLRNPDPSGLPIYRELKSIADGGKLDPAQVLWDIEEALRNSANGRNGEELRRQLARLEYYLRGSSPQMEAAIRSLERTIRKSLGLRYESLASLVKIHTEGRKLPI